MSTLAAGLGGCDAGSGQAPGAASPTGGAASWHAPDPSILVARSVASTPPMRLADGVTPPTNRWYSSLAFGAGGLPVYPRPLSFTPRTDGFAFGLPRVSASANTISAGAVDAVEVRIDGASDVGVVTDAGPVAVTLATGPAEITLAQGWPAVGVRASDDLTAQLPAQFRLEAPDLATADIGGATYGVVITDGAVGPGTLSLDPRGTAVFFAVPTDGSARAMADALAGSIPTNPAVSYAVDDDARTRIEYVSGSTALALPAARAKSMTTQCGLGTYATVDGTFVVCDAGALEWSVPAIGPSASLDLGHISGAESEAILVALRADVAAAGELPEDSYFGSKALYRLANLAQIASQVGATEEADAVTAILEEQLRLWAEPQGCAQRASRCFVYDPALHGVVGMAPSFGSEDFNDHHFHYGYLLYAAAVAVERNPEIGAEIGSVMDLVAADIAAPTGGTYFPERRVFDPVAGHSWASGYAPFADGNNQESSSEAVAAWNAVALWAAVREDTELLDSARWMLSAEAAAARSGYLEPDLTGMEPYGHGIVALAWGAKRDYATWFSPDANAILGIQLIPAPPAAAGYLGTIDDAHVTASVTQAVSAGYGVQFGDYLLMYRATAAGEAPAAWEAALALPDSAIDDANSRAYLLAWIAAQGAPELG